MKNLTCILICILLISGLIGCSNEDNNAKSGDFHRATYTGIVVDRFVEEEDENKFDIVAVEIDDGSTVHFTAISTTTIVGGNDILVDDKIEILCENYVSSDYRPILTATIKNNS